MNEDKDKTASAETKLIQFIQDNDLQVGSLLPSERQLAAKLNISRGQLRNAIQKLAHEDMFDVIPQVGTMLKSRQPGATIFKKVLNLDTVDLQSLIEVRISLEVTAAGLAAKRAAQDDIQAIRDACLAYEREASAYSPWHEENIRFHMAIIRAAKNGAIIAIMENLLNEAVLYTRSKQSSYTQERLNRSIREHKAITDAICSHDEAAAVREMSFHMQKMADVAEKLSKIF